MKTSKPQKPQPARVRRPGLLSPMGNVPAKRSRKRQEFDDPALEPCRQLRSNSRIKKRARMRRLKKNRWGVSAPPRSSNSGTFEALFGTDTSSRLRAAARLLAEDVPETELDEVGEALPLPSRPPPDVPGLLTAQPKTAAEKWAHAILKHAEEDADENFVPERVKQSDIQASLTHRCDLSFVVPPRMMSDDSSEEEIQIWCWTFWCRSKSPVVAENETVASPMMSYCFGFNERGRGWVVLVKNPKAEEGEADKPEIQVREDVARLECVERNPMLTVVGVKWGGVQGNCHWVLVLVWGQQSEEGEEEEEARAGVWRVGIRIEPGADDLASIVVCQEEQKRILSAFDISPYCVVIPSPTLEQNLFAVTVGGADERLIVVDVASGDVKWSVSGAGETPLATLDLAEQSCLVTFRAVISVNPDEVESASLSSIVVFRASENAAVLGEYPLPLSEFRGFPIVVSIAHPIYSPGLSSLRLACGVEVPALRDAAEYDELRYGLAGLQVNLPIGSASEEDGETDKEPEVWSDILIEPSYFPPFNGQFAPLGFANGESFVGLVAFANGLLVGVDMLKRQGVFRAPSSPTFFAESFPEAYDAGSIRCLEILTGVSDVVSVWSVVRIEDGSQEVFVAVHSSSLTSSE